MIDWNRLCIQPCISILGSPATLTPKVSQPGAPSYAFNGIWTNHAVEIAEAAGTYRTENLPMLGVAVADFAVLPRQKDSVLYNGLTYDIVNVVQDGQGGCDLYLRRTSGADTVIADTDTTIHPANCACYKCRRRRKT